MKLGMAAKEPCFVTASAPHALAKRNAACRRGNVPIHASRFSENGAENGARLTYFSANTVAAGNDLNPQAAYLYANNALTLAAGNNINLTDVHDLHSEEHDTQTSSFSFFSTSSKRFGSALTKHTKFVWALDGLNKYSIRRFQ